MTAVKPSPSSLLPDSLATAHCAKKTSEFGSDDLSASTYHNQEIGAIPTCKCSLSAGVHHVPGECTIIDLVEAQITRQHPSQALDPSLPPCPSSCCAFCQECLFPASFQLSHPHFQGQFTCLLQREATHPTERAQTD